MKKLQLTVLLCAALFLGVACGNDDDDSGSSVAGDVDESALAASAVLTIDDMPEGWTESAPSEGEGPLDQCDISNVEEGRTGRAESQDFESPGGGMLSHTVAVYEDEAAASASLDAYRENIDCVLDEINAGNIDDDEFEFTGASMGDGTLASVGDRFFVVRVDTGIREVESGMEAPVYFDLVGVQSGRIAYTIIGMDLFAPFPEDVLDDANGIAADRAESVQ